MADIATLDLPIVISRNIWVTEKFCNFYTVTSVLFGKNNYIQRNNFSRQKIVDIEYFTWNQFFFFSCFSEWRRIRWIRWRSPYFCHYQYCQWCCSLRCNPSYHSFNPSWGVFLPYYNPRPVFNCPSNYYCKWTPKNLPYSRQCCPSPAQKILKVLS